ncbi:MAG: DUF1015 domain-containing protein [Balneola sp.]|nr:DUF1015 domain-containing protein [Balneola sp.]MBO6651982.1 DUF1015 domain-containing protein [Balneola sp.]MBO6712704.1 DUF1015 domain-containing protein [Balneola sp.]MBO6801366.1 DUF1015 domain-containing protein [Balneola sp.]MBO6870475.1 DUF1015 domain-containing protein [Balneola sp.]
MAVVKSFKAWRPKPESAKNIISVPYDVINTDEARELARNKPDSFLHVIRPEIDLPESIDIHAEEVYQKGAENLSKLLDSDHFVQEEKDALYVYKLNWRGRSQSGIFGCVSVAEYDNEVILKHELTRPDKEDDRTKHIITQQAHAEPVMITFDDTAGISEMMESVSNSEPLYQVTIEDVEHQIWKVDNSTELDNGFSKIKNLYIADGHHRCASASRTAAQMKKQNPNHTGEEEYNYFPAVVFPMQQMEILSYNRIVYSTPDNFLATLKDKFELTQTTNPEPENKGDICVYLDGSWHTLSLPGSNKSDVASSLDVARLQEHLLEPLLGISDQRTDKNLFFVGGIRGTNELEKLVNSGKADMAISMYPTNIRELVDVSDAGLLMPPKSTWFEPKLRSGFLIHTF